MQVEVLVWIKDKIRGRYLGEHMDNLADSIAKLSQGRENWYIGREGIPVDDSSGEKCEPVIVFECMDLSIGLILFRRRVFNIYQYAVLPICTFFA